MVERLTFSQGQLATYLVCQRRFQLRYLDRLPWPISTDPEMERPLYLGQRFHQLLHRHFLGLPGEELDSDEEVELRRWWETFQARGPVLPAGRRYPELSLTVPVGRHWLTGRFDLLILDGGRATIFDWKTDARPASDRRLQDKLQTRLYLALATEGLAALGRPVKPADISLSYWYANAPEAGVTIAYNRAEHEKNWAEITDLIARIGRQADFPLTEEMAECGRCLYPIVCGRGSGPQTSLDWEPDENRPSLEPEPL